MDNKLKSKTRLAIIQYIFLVLSRKNDDLEKIKEEFNNYFYGKTFSSISERNEFKVNYNKNFTSIITTKFCADFLEGHCSVSLRSPTRSGLPGDSRDTARPLPTQQTMQSDPDLHHTSYCRTCVFN